MEKDNDRPMCGRSLPVVVEQQAVPVKIALAD
jgi:hypothetical protein